MSTHIRNRDWLATGVICLYLPVQNVRALFPKLIPSALDPLWFTVDKPCDDENELSELEEEHQSWLESISKKDYNITPIGKSSEQYDDEDDDDDDEGDDDDDESDTNDDELDTDMIDDRDSPEEVDMDAGGLAVT